jgi:hypothetical protein
VLEEFSKLNPGSAIIIIFNSTGGGVDDCRESYNRMLMLRTFYRMHGWFDQIHKPKFVPVQGEIDLAGVSIPSQVN